MARWFTLTRPATASFRKPRIFCLDFDRPKSLRTYQNVQNGHKNGEPTIIADLRSDTLTTPCAAQRKAMHDAVVGDDVFQEDPTVKELENYCAKLYGKEAGLYVSSGSMGNLLCGLTHCEGRRDVEMIVGKNQHIYKSEQGSFARFGGISQVTLPNQADGTMNLKEIKAAIRNHSDVHQPKTMMICMENTVNICGGAPLTLQYCKELYEFAQSQKVIVHLDGARLLNAAIANQCSVADICQYTDTVTMCLSKGIGAPIGSVIGALGGGWRQAGVLAAAGLCALSTAESRLTKDHERAKRLAQGIKDVKSRHFAVNPWPSTNIVLMQLLTGLDAAKVVAMLGDASTGPCVKCFATPTTPTLIRFVTHSNVSDQHIENAIVKIGIVNELLA